MQASKVRVIAAILLLLTGLTLLGLGLDPSLEKTDQDVNQPVQPPTPAPTPDGRTFDPKDILKEGQSEMGIEGERVRVTKVIDGDTIEIEGGLKVRYIGVDTPETVDPRRPVQCFGKEAANKNRELVEGEVIILEKDVSDTDKFGRLLRYIYLPLEDRKLLFINDYLIREGFAKASSFPPDIKYQEQFLQAEQEARNQGRGLWGRC